MNLSTTSTGDLIASVGFSSKGRDLDFVMPCDWLINEFSSIVHEIVEDLDVWLTYDAAEVKAAAPLLVTHAQELSTRAIDFMLASREVSGDAALQRCLQEVNFLFKPHNDFMQVLLPYRYDFATTGEPEWAALWDVLSSRTDDLGRTINASEYRLHVLLSLGPEKLLKEMKEMKEAFVFEREKLKALRDKEAIARIKKRERKATKVET